MKLIPLPHDKYAKVDDADYDWLMQWNWSAPNDYATRNDYSNGRKHPEVIKMSRLIMGCTKDDGIDVDHRNGDTLDNQRHNLRKSTTLQNIKNQKLRSSNTSGYKGVSWYKTTNRWVAKICVNYRREHLGYFFSLEDAARAYDEAAKELHGEFARLNFPENL